MTTIAFDGVSISCDSQTSSGDCKEFNCIKLFEGLDFFLGCAGYEFQGKEVKRKLKKENTFKSLVLDGLPVCPSIGDGFQALLVGKYEYTDSYYISGGNMFMISPGKKAAIGSGRFLALAAMRAGADSRRAVQIAAELDLYTGGEIHTRYVAG